MIIEKDGFQYDDKISTRRYKGAAKITTPPVPAPPPIPVAPDEAGDEAMRKAREMSGYSKTILTGNLVPKSTGKKNLLG